MLQNQARALHEAGMGKYSQFKKRVLEANLSLVGIGTGLCWTFAGNEAALDFAYGGAGGLIYMSLLQHGADALPLQSSTLSKVKATQARTPIMMACCSHSIGPA